MDLKDLPMNKLIDTVANAIGIIYEPTKIKQIAKAEAETIDILAQAIRKNNDVSIVYKDNQIQVNSIDANVLVERTKTRVALDELRNQYNTDSVMNKAIDMMECIDTVNDEVVSTDWICDFFSKVGHVNDEQIQELWAKILVGEVCVPGTFSRRTLDVLTKLSSQEAILYTKIIPFVLNCQDTLNEVGNRDYFIPSDSGILSKVGISYDDIFRLNNAGLIDSNGLVQTGFDIQPGGMNYIYHDEKEVIKFENNNIYDVRIRSGVYLMTREGVELLKVANYPLEVYDMEEYFTDCKAMFVKNSF